jgi:hypothetical protein
VCYQGPENRILDESFSVRYSLPYRLEQVCIFKLRTTLSLSVSESFEGSKNLHPHPTPSGLVSIQFSVRFLFHSMQEFLRRLSVKLIIQTPTCIVYECRSPELCARADWRKILGLHSIDPVWIVCIGSRPPSITSDGFVPCVVATTSPLSLERSQTLTYSLHISSPLSRLAHHHRHEVAGMKK